MQLAMPWQQDGAPAAADPLAGPPLIEVRGASRIYRRGAEVVRALDRASVTIARARFVACMGPSGSGKSTLLNLIAALDQPSSGEIVVAGQRLGELSEDALAAWRAAHVGLIFQFFNLIPVLSARDNVALPLLLTRLDRGERRRRAETALRIVGLADRAHHSPRTLSGGEQQRVAIARAIVSDPDLIVADEPTGDLDARNAEAILALLRQLAHQFGKTIVMVTHDPRALRYVDEALHLDKGTLCARQHAADAIASMLSPSGAEPAP